MTPPTQSYESHAKLVPGFHYVLSPIMLGTSVYFIFQAIRDFSTESAMFALFVVGVNLIGFYARGFPLGVQDRVIRLEEQLRMERLLPDDLRARAAEISTDQLIGLRFASDEELPDLVRQVLDGGITDRKAIKKAVKNWRADNQRI